MSLLNNIKKYYKGNLRLNNISKAEYKNISRATRADEQRIAEIYGYDWDEVGIDEATELSEKVTFLKNIVTFAEITSYKGKNIRDMSEREKQLAIKAIINNLSQLTVIPDGYEVKTNSIILCFYLNSIIDAFSIDFLDALMPLERTKGYKKCSLSCFEMLDKEEIKL